MISDTVKPSNLKKVYAENNSQNGRRTVAAEDLNGRPKDMAMAGFGPFSHGNCGQETISGVLREHVTNGTVQPDVESVRLPGDLTLQYIYSNSNDLEDDEDDSDWEPIKNLCQLQSGFALIVLWLILTVFYTVVCVENIRNLE